MKKISYNDGLGHRSRHSMFVLYDNITDVIVEFKGQNIDGLATIVNESYDKNGKWSSTTYEILVADHIESFKWTQSWEEGMYIPESEWTMAYESFKSRSSMNVSFEAFELFARTRLNESAQRLDETVKRLSNSYSSSLMEAIKAEQQLKAELQKMIATKEEDEQAIQINQKVNAVKAKMTGKLSLEELRELYNSL